MKYVLSLFLSLVFSGLLLADTYYVTVTWDDTDVPLAIRWCYMNFECEVQEHGNTSNDDEWSCVGWIPNEETGSVHFLNIGVNARWDGFVKSVTKRKYGWNGVWYLVTPDFEMSANIPAADEDCEVHTTLTWQVDPYQGW